MAGLCPLMFNSRAVVTTSQLAVWACGRRCSQLVASVSELRQKHPVTTPGLFLVLIQRQCAIATKTRVVASGIEERGGGTIMGRIFVVELEGRSYRCKYCKTHLALAEDVISQAFHSRRGKAYLFNKAVNITLGTLEERVMLSGLHTVGDIFCCCCGQIVGWKYV